MFGAETLVLTETIIKQLEEAHVSFLRQVTHKHAIRRRYGSWGHMTAEVVIQGEGTQNLRTYVYRQQATVAEWVSTRPIFDVCARETG